MTPGDLDRLKRLQGKEHRREPLDAYETVELVRLRRELAMAPEVADDKSTLFTNESRRPQLDGTDYNDRLKAMTCDELAVIAERVGHVIFDAAVAALVAKR